MLPGYLQRRLPAPRTGGGRAAARRAALMQAPGGWQPSPTTSLQTSCSRCRDVGVRTARWLPGQQVCAPGCDRRARATPTARGARMWGGDSRGTVVGVQTECNWPQDAGVAHQDLGAVLGRALGSYAGGGYAGDARRRQRLVASVEVCVPGEAETDVWFVLVGFRQGHPVGGEVQDPLQEGPQDRERVRQASREAVPFPGAPD